MVVFEKKVTLFPSYFDLNDKIKLQSVLALFQDVACEHGELLGVGFDNMVKRGLYWIVTRIKFDILKQPKMYQQVLCRTWPHKSGRVDFDRDFLILDEDGQVLIKGTSKWCFISIETRKLAIASDVLQQTEICPDVLYGERFLKTPSIARGEVAEFSHVVEYHEIDHNMHLNNVNYANYVFDTLKSDGLNFLQINFVSECILGDKIEVFKQQQPDGSTIVCGYVGDVLKFSALAR